AGGGGASGAGRRGLDGAGGGAVGDPVLAARHRALAAPGPDAGLAGEIARAAAAAAARGAVADAVELAGHALRLTAAGAGEYDGRVLALGRDLTDAGGDPRAAALLGGRVGAVPAGPARAGARPRRGAGAGFPAGARGP